MNLYEYQGKRLLGEAGIAIPAGEVVLTPQQALEAVSRLGGDTWVVKAQILAGGRGRGFISSNPELSGICYARSPADAEQLAGSMLGQSLITEQTGSSGSKVSRVYIERAETPERMLSVSLLVDTRINQTVLVYTANGGSDIEKLARDNPEDVHTMMLPSDAGIGSAEAGQICSNLGIPGQYSDRLVQLISSMCRLYRERDATLVEINPLAFKNGEFIALDAKISLDENAMYRQPGNRQLSLENYQNDGRYVASRDGFNYFEMDGNIGCLSVGAGLSMATIDALIHLGGRPANFLDLPPDSGVARTHSAIRLILENKSVKVLLINVFGGGIMRCDTISDALLMANSENKIGIPVVVRLSGTNVELAVRRVRESLPEASVFTEFGEAAATAVSRVG